MHNNYIKRYFYQNNIYTKNVFFINTKNVFLCDDC